MTLPFKLPIVVASLVLATGAAGQLLDPGASRAPGGAEVISIAVKDGDLAEVLRLFARVGQFNLVLDPAVKGRTVTITLDEVPWDQAMGVVLQSQGLASVSEGNVVRVAPTAKLVADEHQRAQLREAREQSGELRTIAVSLSNADATQAEAIIRKALSPRGSTSIDKRTNTILITDVFPEGVGLGETMEPAPSLPAGAALAASADFDVRLLEVDEPDPVDPSSADALADGLAVDSARVVLGGGQRASLVLGDDAAGNAVSVTMSPQRDGDRTVLVVRAALVGRAGASIGRALTIGSTHAIALPGRAASGRSLVLLFVPVS